MRFYLAIAVLLITSCASIEPQSESPFLSNKREVVDFLKTIEGFPTIDPPDSIVEYVTKSGVTRIERPLSVKDSYRLKRVGIVLKKWLQSIGYLSAFGEIHIESGMMKIIRGGVWKYGSVEIEPALPKNYIPISPGGKFTTKSYEGAKSLISSYWTSLGYLSGKFKQTTVKRSKGSRVDVVLNFDRGKIYKIKGIHILSGSKYKSWYIEELSGLSLGDVLSEMRVSRATNRISSNPRFSTAAIIPDLSSKKDGEEYTYVDINISVRDANTRSLEMEVSASTEEGVGSDIVWTDTVSEYFDYRLRASVSRKAKIYDLVANLPLLFSTNYSATIMFSGQNLDTDSYFVRQHLIQPRIYFPEKILYGFKLSPSAYLRVLNVISDTGLPSPKPFLSAGMSVGLSSDSDGLRKFRYTLQSFIEGYSYDSLYGSKAGVSGSVYYPFEAIGVGVSSAIGGLSSKTMLPSTEMFFLGGEGKVRGYSVDEVSVLGHGGNSYMSGTVSVYFNKNGSFSPLIFADAGILFYGSASVFASSVGAGVVAQTSIGSITAQLAVPLNKRSKFPSMYLTLGRSL